MLDFNEIEKTLSKEEALTEASRCLSCKNPQCELGCPASLPIRDYIKLIKENNLEKALEIINNKSTLSNICSIVCPHENQCQGHCILNRKGNPIKIGKLESFINENTNFNYQIHNSKDYKVAIIGGGPAGISCAITLAKEGFKVTIFEKEKRLGGILTYGIPEFRLAYDKVQRILDTLKQLNIRVITEKYLSYQEIEQLKEEYDKVFIGIGLPNTKKLGIINENAIGVFDALDLLKQVNKNIRFNEGTLPVLKGVSCVIGAGNVAIDAARSALRLGSSAVYIVYRRSLEEAPASKTELDIASKEGIKFQFLTNPVEVLVDDSNKVTGIKCEIMKLGEKDSSGRARPVGSNEFITINCDNVIKAIGQNPDKANKKSDIALDYGYIVTDDSFKTSVSDIYAGGDIVFGAQTVVKAMVSGNKAALDIILEYNEK